ncbi:MAG TPA: MarR family transcriptional regulator [Microscillaceae bacterium]|nr:MarR family transcriptional regulator [Microscillaceae bacterium]
MASIEKDLNRTFPDNKHKLVVNLTHTSNWIKNRYTEFLKSYGISTQQMNILRISRNKGDWLPMNTVKELMIEKAPNATRIADKLVTKGLIERSRSEEDRRVVYIKITKKGLDMLKEFDIAHEKSLFRFTDNITDKEAKLVSDILDKLRE